MRTYRIQIEVSEDRFRELEALIEECGFTTKKEFFDNAFTLLKWALKKAKGGLSIASINERDGKYTELQMPFLQAAQERAHQAPAGHAA